MMEGDPNDDSLSVDELRILLVHAREELADLAEELEQTRRTHLRLQNELTHLRSVETRVFADALCMISAGHRPRLIDPCPLCRGARVVNDPMEVGDYVVPCVICARGPNA